jgi:tRNA A37 threonylcarbamoyladenosine modification protein TsaB
LGLYIDDILVEEIESSEKTSDILMVLIKDMMDRYDISSIIYSHGPGSYMSTKLTYIILKSIEIIDSIPFYGCSAFLLNGGKPIKAMGNLYFIKEKEAIITKRFDKPIEQNFKLPIDISHLEVKRASVPDYQLPAV